MDKESKVHTMLKASRHRAPHVCVTHRHISHEVAPPYLGGRGGGWGGVGGGGMGGG